MVRIILPGDKISDRQLPIDSATYEQGKTYATVMGLFDDERGTFIPLENIWYPRTEDEVIGMVEEARNGVYTIDLNSPFKGLVITRRDGPDLELNVGDVMSAIVRDVNRESDKIILILVRARKLFGGRLIAVKPSKVPRVIGKSNTMLNLLADGTKSSIKVGMNGIIWLKGGDTALAVKAIKKIQEEAHVSGLTDRITKMLKESQ